MRTYPPHKDEPNFDGSTGHTQDIIFENHFTIFSLQNFFRWRKEWNHIPYLVSWSPILLFLISNQMLLHIPQRYVITKGFEQKFRVWVIKFELASVVKDEWDRVCYCCLRYLPNVGIWLANLRIHYKQARAVLMLFYHFPFKLLQTETSKGEESIL